MGLLGQDVLSRLGWERLVTQVEIVPMDSSVGGDSSYWNLGGGGGSHENLGGEVLHGLHTQILSVFFS